LILTKKKIFVILWIFIALPLASYFFYHAWKDFTIIEKIEPEIRYKYELLTKELSANNSVMTDELSTKFMALRGELVELDMFYTFFRKNVLLAATLIILPLLYIAFAAIVRMLKSRKKLLILLPILVASWYYITSIRPKMIATEHVALELIDPESARFRDLRIVGNAVCGEVNRKNHSGGYTGFTSFIYQTDNEVVDIERDYTDLSIKEIQLNDAIHSKCRNK
jgi:hypothetical protein